MSSRPRSRRAAADRQALLNQRVRYSPTGIAGPRLATFCRRIGELIGRSVTFTHFTDGIIQPVVLLPDPGLHPRESPLDPSRLVDPALNLCDLVVHALDEATRLPPRTPYCFMNRIPHGRQRSHHRSPRGGRSETAEIEVEGPACERGSAGFCRARHARRCGAGGAAIRPRSPGSAPRAGCRSAPYCLTWHTEFRCS